VSPPQAQEGPLLGGLSVVAQPVTLVTRVQATLERANLPLLASALTFDALLAIIPLAILVATGLGYAFSSLSLGNGDPSALISRLLPAHPHVNGQDRFALIEALITKVQGYRSQLTWPIILLFLWFSTRLIAAVRICLSQIFQVRQRPVRGHFVWSYIAGYLLAKASDLIIVLIVLVLALANTVITTGLSVVASRGVELSRTWGFLVTAGGQIGGRAVAFVFGIALFVLLYRYASPKRLAWGGTLLASVVGTLGFELAKRLFGLYLAHAARGGQYALDPNLTSILLFILWLWYMSLVFLTGAAVADVWDHARQARLVEKNLATEGKTAI
jgi:membrane protein